MNPKSPSLKPNEHSLSKEIKDFYMDEIGFFTHITPKKFANASLENCDKQSSNLIEFGKKWALNPTSIFLCGGYGTGKTYYAFAILRELFRKYPMKIWPRYFTSPELDSKLLRASKSEDGDEYLIKDIASQDLLFIDDIGRETKSDRLRRQYFEILNYRYTNELVTILTSNLCLDQLGEVIDGAIASRIQEWQIIEFKGPDLRRIL